MQCASPLFLPAKAEAKTRNASEASSYGQWVRCGDCIHCLQHAANCRKGRILLEFLFQNRIGSFNTLTYRAENLPAAFLKAQRIEAGDIEVYGDPVPSLYDQLGVGEIKAWAKALKRKCRDKGLPVPKILTLSEFGGVEGRPHHHVAVLGLPMYYHQEVNALGGVDSNFDLHPWASGFINQQPLNEKTAGYYSGYLGTKAPDACIRNRGDSAGKSAVPDLAALYMQSLPQDTRWVFSNCTLDLRGMGFGVYPLDRTMRLWFKDAYERMGVTVVDHRIENPGDQPNGLAFTDACLRREYSPTELVQLAVMKRQSRLIREQAAQAMRGIRHG